MKGRRRAYLSIKKEIELGTRGVDVFGYGKNGKFVCRLEINSAGLAVYAGPRGRKKLANVGWENLVKRLSQ